MASNNVSVRSANAWWFTLYFIIFPLPFGPFFLAYFRLFVFASIFIYLFIHFLLLLIWYANNFHDFLFRLFSDSGTDTNLCGFCNNFFSTHNRRRIMTYNVGKRERDWAHFLYMNYTFDVCSFPSEWYVDDVLNNIFMVYLMFV